MNCIFKLRSLILGLDSLRNIYCEIKSLESCANQLGFSERSVLGLGSIYILLFLDIDECAAQVNPCDAVVNSECENTDGSYNCQCKDGFVKNGANCQNATQF